LNYAFGKHVLIVSYGRSIESQIARGIRYLAVLYVEVTFCELVIVDYGENAFP